jgi:hypothetical protein
MVPKSRSRSGKTLRQRRERRDAFASAIPKTAKRAIGRSTTRETPLHVRSRKTPLNGAALDYVRGRVAFKLGKYGLRLTRITVRFDNVSGPKGAPEYVCTFKIVLPNAQQVVVAAAHVSTRAAFDLAVAATERAVRRLLERTETLRTRR